ncbi:PHP domain-containing protein [Zavarzinella formosa]|uniref:PHP domain-containing protein n=1 Tax=Zavarzinella formosa TaxID=360055 RepID=UPI00030947E5|nr:PHP domain-containing protein [Zavarzinella formosa]
MNGSRFTQICSQLARLRDPFRADLHLHTNFSDGTHTPADLIARASAAKLGAIAVTDHDTTAAVAPLRSLGRMPTVIAGVEVDWNRSGFSSPQNPAMPEVIAGVEITCVWHGREIHLLGYFIDPTSEPLQTRLRWVRDGRRERAIEMGRRLPALKASVEERVALLSPDVSLGRRHIARWLIEEKAAGSLHDAFTRLLNQPEMKEIPKQRLPLEEAIQLVRQAGGVSSFAHPPEETTRETLAEMQSLGLDAVEGEYPWPSKARGKRLREWAAELGLLVTGGSDSHDPAPATRNVGSRAIGRPELDKLRALANERRG